MNDIFDNVLVVLVIYQTEIQNSYAFQTLSVAMRFQNKKGHIFIYDNSLNAQVIPAQAEWNIFYQHDSTNPGVSKAFNQGFKKAKELKKNWLMLADQDTHFPPNLFDEYATCIEEFHVGIVVPILKDDKGYVSPFKFNLGGGQRLNSLKGRIEMMIADFYFANSGLLISADLFEQAGLYDENLPLDFSDMGFKIRLQKQISTFVLANVVCTHELSSSRLDSSESIKRFKIYKSAAVYFRKNYLRSFWLPIRIFLRAIKLSVGYKNFEFVKSILKK